MKVKCITCKDWVPRNNKKSRNPARIAEAESYYKDLGYSTQHCCCAAKSLASCPSVCDLMDYSPPVSSVHGIFKGKMLEWVAIFYVRGSSLPRGWTCISCICCTGRRILLPLVPPGKPLLIIYQLKFLELYLSKMWLLVYISIAFSVSC